MRLRARVQPRLLEIDSAAAKHNQLNAFLQPYANQWVHVTVLHDTQSNLC